MVRVYPLLPRAEGPWAEGPRTWEARTATAVAPSTAVRWLAENAALFLFERLAVDATNFSELQAGRHDLFAAVNAVQAVKVGTGLGGNSTSGFFQGVFIELGLDGRGPVIFVGEFEVVLVFF